MVPARQVQHTSFGRLGGWSYSVPPTTALIDPRHAGVRLASAPSSLVLPARARDRRGARQDQADPAALEVASGDGRSGELGALVAPLPQAVAHAQKPVVRRAGSPCASAAKPHAAPRAPRTRSRPRRCARSGDAAGARASPRQPRRARSVRAGRQPRRPAPAAAAGPRRAHADAARRSSRIGEALPSSRRPWPAWVFSLLGVLAAAEAVPARAPRARPPARGG